MSTDNELLQQIKEVLASSETKQASLLHRTEKTFDQVDDIFDNIERIEYLLIALLSLLLVVTIFVTVEWYRKYKLEYKNDMKPIG